MLHLYQGIICLSFVLLSQAITIFMYSISTGSFTPVSILFTKGYISKLSSIWFLILVNQRFEVTRYYLRKTHIVAGNDYYPFGLPIVERSYEKQDYRYDYHSLSRFYIFYIGRQYAEKDDETG